MVNNHSDVHSKIIQYFSKNLNPTDKDIHNFANELGISLVELENHIYMVLTNLLKNVGKHKNVPDNQFDAQQLKRGIEVEMEHTNDPAIAKEIAKDHLVELPDYYTRLDKMEAEGGKKYGTVSEFLERKLHEHR